MKKVTALILVLVSLSCTKEKQETTGGKQKIFVGKVGYVPDWYRITFIMNYSEGKRYEGECSWPLSYDNKIHQDLQSVAGMVPKGKIVNSVRKVSGPQVYNFQPHGRGKMIHPGGTVVDGYWKAGKYIGKTPSIANKKI